MPSPIRPSDWCATVVDATAALCAKIESLLRIPELLCDYYTWKYTSTGEFSSEYKALLQAGVGVPTGTMIWQPIANVPEGYLEANGQAVSRTDYAALFTIYSTTFGTGNGTTTFNLPDLRNRAAIGQSGTKPIGTTGGAETVLLTEAQLPSHSHGLPDGVVTFPGSQKFNDTSGNELSYTAATDTDPVGGGQAFSILNPYLAGVWLVKT
jgi:microcystin-dependent protein